MISMPECNQITLRAATAQDRDFLLAVFASTREDELRALADSAMIQNFVSMQFNAQLQSYQAAYPEAENSVIFLGERPIGRMLVDRAPEVITLVDIALLTEFRARGVGSMLLHQLIDEAATEGKSIRLSVFKFNPAVRLYERLGFSKVAADGLYIQMRWGD